MSKKRWDIKSRCKFCGHEEMDLVATYEGNSTSGGDDVVYWCEACGTIVSFYDRYDPDWDAWKFPKSILNTFELWDGEYEKEFYDVILPTGEYVKWCYPNAGKMIDVHTPVKKEKDQREWTPKDKIKIRVAQDHPLDED